MAGNAREGNARVGLKFTKNEITYAPLNEITDEYVTLPNVSVCTAYTYERVYTSLGTDVLPRQIGKTQKKKKKKR